MRNFGKSIGSEDWVTETLLLKDLSDFFLRTRLRLVFAESRHFQRQAGISSVMVNSQLGTVTSGGIQLFN